ncbi:MAG: ATP-binding cassette domain-containing protein [Planctomycetes bacterium]|nr:ATP-binding cassette domain-containing protein [Planctomycetota bacterium]
MIESIQFTNFKALRKASFPLAPFTLILGPNGSGKTTVLQALQGIATYAANQGSLARKPDARRELPRSTVLSVTADGPKSTVEVTIRARLNKRVVCVTFRWNPDATHPAILLTGQDGSNLEQEDTLFALRWLGRIQVYALDYLGISQPTLVTAGPSLECNGAGLASVLDLNQA